MKLLFDVFIAGSTGYLGRPLGERLTARGHQVYSLARRGSEQRIPRGSRLVVGDALNAASYASLVPRGAVFVHLVGVPHPSPSKAAEFLSVDLPSLRASVEAATQARARRFVYVSVAHPAPVMQAYVAARQASEAILRESGLTSTVLRPWYVLGPGHRWPLALLPMYALASLVPGWRQSARRLGLVTHRQMINALTDAVELTNAASHVIDVPGIRSAGGGRSTAPARSIHQT
jgi:nucleoside-diphosphate-sugar epimerase